MKYDAYGQGYTDSNELCNLLYSNPEVDISAIKVIDPAEYNTSIATMFAQMPILKQYTEVIGSLDEFDVSQQANWHMPDEYKQLDIAAYILSLCKEDYELQRVAQELLLYQERDLFNLLRYLKYLVDTLRKNKVVWGVGRGSSVASYVLYLLGVHKINSMHYQLDITEFLK
jgi:DNA polymerase III alpha subunit